MCSRLRHNPASSSSFHAESSSSPADRQFASGCSPPHLTATQLPSATGPWLTPARTSTVLCVCACERTGSRLVWTLLRTCCKSVQTSLDLQGAPLRRHRCFGRAACRSRHEVAPTGKIVIHGPRAMPRLHTRLSMNRIPGAAHRGYRVAVVEGASLRRRFALSGDQERLRRRASLLKAALYPPGFMARVQCRADTGGSA